MFSTTTAHRLEAVTGVDNLAEQRALEPAGFIREGVLRGRGFVRGQRRDGYMYSPLRDDDGAPLSGPAAMGAATFPVFAYLVLHPAGPILIDSGVGNSFIDELYSPVHHDLDEAWTNMA